MKEITIRQMASIKRSAQNVYPMVAKKNKIAAKIQELGQEYNALTEQIMGWEGAVISMTGGLTSEALIQHTVKEVLDAEGRVILDDKGNPKKVTKYEVRDTVAFDDKKKVYLIPEESDAPNNAEAVAEAPVEEAQDNAEESPLTPESAE